MVVGRRQTLVMSLLLFLGPLMLVVLRWVVGLHCINSVPRRLRQLRSLVAI